MTGGKLEPGDRKVGRNGFTSTPVCLIDGISVLKKCFHAKKKNDSVGETFMKNFNFVF